MRKYLRIYFMIKHTFLCFFLYFCIITYSLLYECQAFAECLGYGGEGVESYAITACLDAGNVCPLHLHTIGKVLLCHSFLLSQLGNMLPYALPFLLVLDHSFLSFLVISPSVGSQLWE